MGASIRFRLYKEYSVSCCIMFACTDYLQHVAAKFSSKRIMQNKRTTQQRQMEGDALSQNNPYLFVSIYNKTII